MSGSHFEYSQYDIKAIGDEISKILDSQGKEIPKDEQFLNNGCIENGTGGEYYETFPEKVEEKFKEAVEQLKRAYVYVQRIDWYLSGDDSEETFLERLEEDLTKLKQ